MLPERFKPQAAVAFASACAAVGLLTIYDSVLALLGIWRTDALKQIGMVVPIICFALILRAWRSIGWETEGSWWGFVVLAISSILVFLRDQMLLIVTVNKDWLLQLPPLPLVAVIYATGMVLLFGGKRLLRAAWFPVLLMWAVIPVPQTFSHYVDLPLQHAGASVARGFAHLIGAKLSTQDLNILFTPKFGMFIAPGCDGLRGSITLGLTAIVVGYVYRFRWFIFAPVVVGAVLLGYVFNLLRLCSLVIYDRIAVTFPALQLHEQLADHIVGGCLFLLAAFLFFTMIEKLRRDPKDVNAALVEEKPALGPVARLYLAKVMAILLLSTVFGLEAVHAAHVEAKSATAAVAPPPMPQHIGNFSLVRTWSEGLIDGTVVYVWGEYETPDGTHVSLGISPELGVHDAEVCHIARGENPTWHGQIEVPSSQGAIALTAATYNDGQVQKLEASTVCDGGICRQYSQTNQRFTVVYAKPHRTLPLEADTTRPVPVLLKVETSDTGSPVSEVEPKLAAGLQEFLKSADLVGLAIPYSRR
ncbi:MAG TPA: exosortase J [Granulicella sp.]|jgi:exosortase J